jgi:hypothetical protein
MTMTPRLRKLTLTTHIVFSVGWLGAIVPYLALAIAGLASHDAQMVRAAYLSMEVIGWFVIVPFSLAALSSGLVQSLGTQWGLFRHWWILLKFVLTIVAIVVLLRHMQDVSRVSRLSRETMMSSADFRPELIHAAGGLLVVLGVTMLSMFKPWGMTPYGLRKAGSLTCPPVRATPPFLGAMWSQLAGYAGGALSGFMPSSLLCCSSLSCISQAAGCTTIETFTRSATFPARRPSGWRSG